MQPRAKLKRADISLSNHQSIEETQTQGFRPRADLSPWPIADSIDWAADPFKEDNWRFQLHALRIVDPFIIAFFGKPERALAEYVLKILLSWSRYADTQPSDSMTWHDMATGLRAMKIAFLIDIAADMHFPLDTRHHLERIAAEHIQHLTNPAERSLSNHGLFQIWGAEILTFVCPDAFWATKANILLREHLDALLPRQFTPEGVHREQSPGYHFFATRNFQKLPSIARLSPPTTKDIISKASKIAPWFLRPDKSIVPFGDTDAGFRVAADPNGIRHGDFIVSDFDQSGYCIIRSIPTAPIDTSSMLFFTGIRWNRSHKHDDDLAFELVEFGRPIITDAGKYAYKRDALRAYAKRQTAHSTAGIAEDDSRNRPTELYGSALQKPIYNDDYFRLIGKVKHPAYRHTRVLSYKPGKWLVVKDLLRSPTPQRYVSRLLFDAEVDVTQHASGLLHLTLPNSHFAEVFCSHPITLLRGTEKPLRGWQTKSYGKLVPTTLAEAWTTDRAVTIRWKVTFFDNRASALATRRTPDGDVLGSKLTEDRGARLATSRIWRALLTTAARLKRILGK